MPPGSGTSIAALIRAEGTGMRIARIAAVTAGLVIVGAIVGTVVSTAIAMYWAPLRLWYLPHAFRFGVGIGAPVGAVLGPVAAWLLMRHVPLGHAIGGTALGTLAGAALGLLLLLPQFVYMGAVLGFVVAVARLSGRTPWQDGRIDPPPGGTLPRE
ncbi:MAG: hypothetical protein ABW277_17710 [Longimicrobiaceae bacterium]